MAENFHSNVSILAKFYDFYKELYLSLGDFPKKHRYSLGQKIDNTALEIFTLLVSARNSQRKLEILKKADNQTEVLKLLMRLTKDTRSFNDVTVNSLEEKLKEIGKMLGGWIKANTTEGRG